MIKNQVTLLGARSRRIADHPRTVCLGDDEVTVPLDEWIATVADPDNPARGQDADPAAGTGYAVLQRQLSEANGTVAALMTALECGMAVEDLTAALRRRTAERDELKGRLERAERPGVMAVAQIKELVDESGGPSAVLSAASAAERADVHKCLCLRLDYGPYRRRVKATADLSRFSGCVIAASPPDTLDRSGVNASIPAARRSRVSEDLAICDAGCHPAIDAVNA